MTPTTSFSPLSGSPEPQLVAFACIHISCHSFGFCICRKGKNQKRRKRKNDPLSKETLFKQQDWKSAMTQCTIVISIDMIPIDSGTHCPLLSIYMIHPRTQMIHKRQKTQISVLANQSYPDANSLFDFQNKPPLLLFTYIFAFIASIDCFVNIPTLYAACNEAAGSNSYYYVFILGIYVITQFISTLFIGAWLDRRGIIEILTFLTVCIIIGNIIYTFGVHDKDGMYMLVGRGICGVGSCILVLGYAHVTRYTKLASRESRILYFRFVIALGTMYVTNLTLLHLPFTLCMNTELVP